MRLSQSLVFALAATGPSIPLFLATSCSGPSDTETLHLESGQLFDLLDTGQDGTLSPFEALDALLVIAEDGDLTRDTLKDFLNEYAEDELAESRDFFDIEGAELYASLVEDIGEPVRLEGAPLDLVNELRSIDLNGDGIATQQEAVQMIRDELAGATFEVVGECAIMRGVIGATTPATVLELAFTNPEVRTIVLANVPGSIDDWANIRAARYIRKLGLDTHVPADGEVASGGVDLFLAGNNRSAEPGALFGIHSWDDGGPVPATDLPKDHVDHQLYLDYYAEMGIPAKFYWRTLAAAPPEGNHWMMEDEFERFSFFTDSPAYLK